MREQEKPLGNDFIDQPLKTEAVPLLLIYLEDGQIKTKINELDIQEKDYVTLYGHLKLYVERIERRFVNEEP